MVPGMGPPWVEFDQNELCDQEIERLLGAGWLGGGGILVWDPRGSSFNEFAWSVQKFD